MGSTQKTTWIVKPNMPGLKKLPEWIRSVALVSDGRIFIPAALAGNESAVLMCALSDGAATMISSGHLYAESKWLAKEFKAVAEVCARVEAELSTFSE